MDCGKIDSETTFRSRSGVDDRTSTEICGKSMQDN